MVFDFNVDIIQENKNEAVASDCAGCLEKSFDLSAHNPYSQVL